MAAMTLEERIEKLELELKRTKRQKPRAGLSVGKEGPKLTLFDKKGNEHWSTPSTK